ncbi:hypothetical protein CEXT_210761 [Caerostris extrusa]|uniref:Uncharacterized protein n=1 Tax=Caerostris extrusa TaxID=172846 RepID=A0AAV4XK65_CAEEX|nr:hypothetical protein CEXT_210761 [Caerostris extrusa]
MRLDIDASLIQLSFYSMHYSCFQRSEIDDGPFDSNGFPVSILSLLHSCTPPPPPSARASAPLRRVVIPIYVDMLRCGFPLTFHPCVSGQLKKMLNHSEGKKEENLPDKGPTR